MTASKTLIAAASVAALLTVGVAGSASAQPYRGSGYNHNSNGCSSNRQASGALIGALVGAAAGSNLSRNDRTVGALIGGALGAGAGSYIGCQNQRSDYGRHGRGQGYASSYAYGYDSGPRHRQGGYDRGYDRGYQSQYGYGRR